MPNVVIIEDELPNAQRLEKMLLSLDSGIIIKARLQTVTDSVRWFKTHDHPDIVFMDIRLTDGLIFDLFNHITINSPVIFTTAYDEYALRAFEVNGIDYLLKPIEAEKLEKSLNKAFHLKAPWENSQISELLKNIDSKRKIYRERFLIPYRDTYILIMATEIAYFSIENRINYLTTHAAKRYPIEHNMEMLEKELDPDIFFRVSRQVMVSLKSITKINQYFNSQLKIELSPNLIDSILMSRERSNQLKKWLEHT